MLVNRFEINRINEMKGWLLIFGRRKVGKTFLLKNFIEWDRFFMVKRDGSVINEKEKPVVYDDVQDLLSDLKFYLKNNETVVLDEFQRLPESFWDEISLIHPEGRLILSGSSLRIVDRVLSNNSPLLGMVYPVKIPLIKPSDILKGLSDRMDPVRAITMSPFMQDPWTIPMLEEKEDILDIIPILRYVVPGLLGEVFSEEERELTRTYESIISLLGSGMEDYNRMGKVLCDRGIVSNPNSSSVIPYLKNLVKMGLVTEYRKWKERGSVYRLTSRVMKTYYYLESRYDLENRDVPSDEMEPTLNKLVQFSVEEFLADFFGDVLQGRVEVLKKRDMELDIFVTRRNKPYLVGEVKWGKADNGDMEKFKEKVEDFSCRKVFVTREKLEDDEIEVLGPEDIIKAAMAGTLIKKK
jgi:hypothetical protein